MTMDDIDRFINQNSTKKVNIYGFTVGFTADFLGFEICLYSTLEQATKAIKNNNVPNK